MIRVDLDISVCEEKEAIGACDPPSQELDEVQRRFIGPLGVFEHKNTGAQGSRKKVECCFHDGSSITRGERFRHGPILSGDVPNRSKGLWRYQIVARSEQRVGSLPRILEKAANECALADASLPAYEDDSTTRRRYVVEESIQLHQLRFSLKDHMPTKVVFPS